MNKLPVPSLPSFRGRARFSEEVPFPSAEMKFLDGLKVEMYPDSSMPHSIMGVHYILEGRDEEGQVAAIRVTFSSRKRASGEGFERYMELEPMIGQPLASIGKNYAFHFRGKSPSFVPRDNSYKMNQVTPGGDYTIEVSPSSLNCLRLFYEQPSKNSEQADF